MPYSKIVGTGSYLPERILRNEDLEKLVLYNLREDPDKKNPLKTSDIWMREKGFVERRIISEDMSIGDMGKIAALRALDNAFLDVSAVDELIVACNSQEKIFPSVAGEIQDKLGLRKIKAYDIQAGCTASIYALDNADASIQRAANKYGNKNYTVLVVGTDALSRIVNWTDRNTCVLFGDGAGAAILQLNHEGDGRGILACWLATDGSGRNALVMPSGISKENSPFAYLEGKLKPEEKIMHEAEYFKMGGYDTFKFAVRAMRDAAVEVCKRAGIKIEDIDVLIPHDANKKIIDSAVKLLGISSEKVYSNIQRYANTSAPSILINLDDANRTGRLKRENIVCLDGFGAGLTYGALIMRW